MTIESYLWRNIPKANGKCESENKFVGFCFVHYNHQCSCRLSTSSFRKYVVIAVQNLEKKFDAFPLVWDYCVCFFQWRGSMLNSWNVAQPNKCENPEIILHNIHDKRPRTTYILHSQQLVRQTCVGNTFSHTRMHCKQPPIMSFFMHVCSLCMWAYLV